jgi:hypothetical protein
VATETATATETEVQQVLETGLSECLGKCKSAWTLQAGNSHEQNTYALPSHSTAAFDQNAYALPSHTTEAALGQATGSSYEGSSHSGAGY